MGIDFEMEIPSFRVHFMNSVDVQRVQGSEAVKKCITKEARRTLLTMRTIRNSAKGKEIDFMSFFKTQYESRRVLRTIAPHSQHFLSLTSELPENVVQIRTKVVEKGQYY